MNWQRIPSLLSSFGLRIFATFTFYKVWLFRCSIQYMHYSVLVSVTEMIFNRYSGFYPLQCASFCQGWYPCRTHNFTFYKVWLFRCSIQDIFNRHSGFYPFNRNRLTAPSTGHFLEPTIASIGDDLLYLPYIVRRVIVGSTQYSVLLSVTGMIFNRHSVVRSTHNSVLLSVTGMISL